MKHLIAVAAVIAEVAATSATAGTPRPACHWTHHKAAGVNVYVQVCKTPAKPKHHVDPRWTSAGPGNSPAPRIG